MALRRRQLACGDLAGSTLRMHLLLWLLRLLLWHLLWLLLRGWLLWRGLLLRWLLLHWYLLLLRHLLLVLARRHLRCGCCRRRGPRGELAGDAVHGREYALLRVRDSRRQHARSGVRSGQRSVRWHEGPAREQQQASERQRVSMREVIHIAQPPRLEVLRLEAAPGGGGLRRRRCGGIGSITASNLFLHHSFFWIGRNLDGWLVAHVSSVR